MDDGRFSDAGDGPVFQITEAKRKATPALIALWGPSFSGKTYSALRIARGIVGPKGKIGLIDTENRRAEFYDQVAGGWKHLDFQPPFSPQRYTAAFRAFEDAQGIGCVIVDSMSHVWEGEGGVLDIAGRNTSPGLQKWNAPKTAYKRMVNALLRAPFHVIFCLRAKEGVRQIGRGKEATIESIGLEPIAEKNFIYEMTVSVLLGPDHRPLFEPIDRFKCAPHIPAVKTPEALNGAVKKGEYLSEETGAAIADWCSGGVDIDQSADALKREARDVASLGMSRLEQFWNELKPGQKRVLKAHMEEMKAIASEADQEQSHDEPEAEDDNPFADNFSGEKATA